MAMLVATILSKLKESWERSKMTPMERYVSEATDAADADRRVEEWMRKHTDYDFYKHL